MMDNAQILFNAMCAAMIGSKMIWTQTDERGPYFLEQVSNADHRRRDRLARQNAELMVGPEGRYAYVEFSGAGDFHVIYFYPHEGEGEPRPAR